MPIFTGRNEASHKEAFYLKKPRVYSTNYMLNGMELPILSELGDNVSDYWSSYFRLSQVGNSQIHLQNNLLEMFDNEKLMEAIPNRKIPSMGEERSLPHDLPALHQYLDGHFASPAFSLSRFCLLHSSNKTPLGGQC